MDVAFRFASRFEQCLHGGALVNVFSQQSPPFLLVLPDWVVRKFGALIRVLKLALASGVFKADSQNSDVCAEVICAHLMGCCWLAFVGAGAKERFQ
ncbi:hypothetical protein [Pseudomonas helvetica]|uniref:hypothetical protein n=1 Tax=Pseudomonas helvetica TaxID=3136738 RepID=UPI0032652C37